MNPNWLVEELEQDLRKGKHPARRVIIILSAALLLGGGAFAIASNHDDGSDTPASRVPITASSDSPMPNLTQTPTTPMPIVVPLVVIAPTTSPAPSMAEAKAKLCIEVITNAKEQGKLYLSEFNDAWKSWNRDFAGRYDSPEADASKQEYKRIIHNMFDDLINTSNPTMRTACDSTDSLANMVLQPNYDAWQ